jgi:hypothetical protein
VIAVPVAGVERDLDGTGCSCCTLCCLFVNRAGRLRAVENTVEVRYAGVVVGRGMLAKELGPDAVFVNIPEPLPVGTRLTLRIGDAVRDASVDEVVESPEPTAVGMRVHWGAASATRPAPAAHAAPAAAPAPAPVEPAPAPAVASSAAAPVVAEDAPVPQAADSGPVSAPTGDSAPIAAPLSLAGPGGDAHGGGKRRRKRR